MYILGSGAECSAEEHNQPQVYPVLPMRARRGTWLLSHSLDAVICESEMGLFPLTNASSTAHDDS